MAVSDLIKQINEVVENPPAPDAVSEEERAHEQVGLRIGIESGIFNTMAAIGIGELTASKIAQRTGAAPLLVSRVMKLLASMGLFKEVAEDKYANGPFSPAFSDASPLPKAAKAHSMVDSVTANEVLMKIPEYLKKTKYQNPENTNDGPFQYAMNIKLQYYDWLKTEPDMDCGEPWYDYYPVASKIETPVDEKAPLMVDVGGNI
ncbi:hypothetical protein BPAE_0140g00170 [Botrytis paeoniae]|uniref:O-methyltransferase dimerisation domain-containing protein n=1 Tax=Botrytis paeoniae TaxID=278948 RepID=A0A4Z1FI93_9HELO|nr:hypothetical protein BPAE_0140g00170 [Botrytis paeoniae]